MTTIVIPEPCKDCKHLWGDSVIIVNNRFGCAAFPDGIPDEIYSGNNSHRKPFPGDNGIQYAKDEA